MKRIALLSLFLALGLICVQPLQADTMAYTIQTNLVIDPLGIDRLGVRSGTCTAIFNFTITTPAALTYNVGDGILAYYEISSATLTLSGTNADGIYTPSSGYPDTSASLGNMFSTSLSPYDGLVNGIRFTIGSQQYNFGSLVDFSKSFWGDNADPSLKPFNLNDITVMNASLGSVNDSGSFDRVYGALYDDINMTASCQVVPLPPSIWLLGCGLLGLAGWRRFRKS
jgi:hypothetical protein